MHCWARYSFVVVVIALGTLSMINACGQKGPLLLLQPGDTQAPTKGTEVPKPSAPTPPPTQAPAPVLPPASNTELLAWPSENPNGCTDACSAGGKYK